MEFSVQNKWESPKFVLISQSGPSHRKQYQYNVIVNEKEYIGAPAQSIKEAKGHAAVECLKMLNVISQSVAKSDMPRKKTCRYSLHNFVLGDVLQPQLGKNSIIYVIFFNFYL